MRIGLWIAILSVGAAAAVPAAQAQAPTPPLPAAASIQAQAIPEAEKEAIIKTALDYGDGFYSGAPERMERALHPDLNKVYVVTIPPTGGRALSYSTYSGLIEMTQAKVGLLDPEKRKIGTAFVLRLNGDIACAKITSAQSNDFLQMVKVDGQWKIVNVLWAPGPDRSEPPPDDCCCPRQGPIRPSSARPGISWKESCPAMRRGWPRPSIPRSAGLRSSSFRPARSRSTGLGTPG